MPVNRTLLSSYLTSVEVPPWLCPTCKSGHFRLIPESLRRSDSAKTHFQRGDEWFDAEHVEYRFVALLKCDNGGCAESSSIAGCGKIDQRPDARMENIEYEDIYYPNYFNPSPRLISVPDRCPPSVVYQLEKAFTASWGDYSAAGNHIRTATEILLNMLRVKKTHTSGKGKRSSLTLHARINSIKLKHPNAHDALLAIKWLGNAGSHPDALTRAAVFDALDIFEAVLDDLFSDHPQNIKKLVAEVIRRRGPTRRKT